MYKKLLQLKTLLIALLVMTGAGNVWAETVTFDPSVFSGQGTSGTGSAISATKDGVTFACDKGYGTTQIRCYSGAKIKISSSNSKTITAISFTFSGSYNGGLKTSYAGLSATTWVKNLSSQARITGVTVTYITSGSVAPSIIAEDLSIAYDAKSGKIDYTISNDVQDGGLTADITDGDWLTLGVVTPETVPFTCSANDGDADRTAKVTLTYTYNTNQTVTKVVTITQAQPVVDYATLPFEWEGGASSALTLLIGVTASGLGSDYAEGNAPYRVKLDTDRDYIQVKTDSQPGTVTIGVKMIGGASTSTITVQGSADGETFTDVEELSISGSQNAVLSLKTSKPFATDSRYVRLLFTKGSNVGVGPITIEKPSTDPAINAVSRVELAAEATSGEIDYTIANPVDGTSLTASEEADWISDVTVQSDKVTFATTANSGESRSAIITLTYGSKIKEVTVSQAEYVAPFEPTTWTLANTITSGKHYIITNGSAKAMGTQANNNRNAVGVTINNNVVSVANSDVTEFVIYGPDANGYYTIFDGNGYLYAASSRNNYLKTETTLDSDNHGLWKITFSEAGVSIVADKSTNRNVMQFNSGSDLFSCYEGAKQSAVSLYEKDGEDIPTENKTLNAYGYATYCSQNALDFSDDSEVTAWAISEANSTTGVITFTQITGKAAAGTGMLLKGEANASVTLTSASGKDDLTNLLIGTTKAHTVLNKGDYYGLSGNTFVPVNAGTVPAGKALLPSNKLTSGSGEVRAYTFVFVDPTTGITETQTVSAEQFGEVFNLAGQRIGQPQKGVNIINGKKVLVK